MKESESRICHLPVAHMLNNIYFDLEPNGLFNHIDCNYVWMHLFKFTARHEMHLH